MDKATLSNSSETEFAVFFKGGANFAMMSFVSLSTSLIVKHRATDCTPKVISGQETTSALSMLVVVMYGPCGIISELFLNNFNALQITNQTLLLF